MPNFEVDHTIADMYYVQLPTGGATQGDIWNNLPSGYDESRRCKGIVITPRCDLAHSKSPVINYLPIVTLEDYLQTMGVFPTLHQVLNDAHENLRKKGVDLGLDGLFELGMPVDEIAKQLGSLSPDPPRGIRQTQFIKARSDFDLLYSKILELRAALKQPSVTVEHIRKYVPHKALQRLQRDLITNNNSDTYFLPPYRNLIDHPSVVLLRHIFTSPIASFDDRIAQGSDPGGSLPLPERLLRLSSPFIESLMSKLAALFTRVGTRDIPDAAVSSFAVFQTDGP
jgi:hypothetical protein